jgi:hypothetical protein
MTAQLDHDVAMPDDSPYDAGFADAWVQRGKLQNTEDCYISVPMAWHLVKVGDVVRSPERKEGEVIVEPARLWTVEQIELNAHRRVGVQARCGEQVLRSGLDRGDAGLDPQAQVMVLEAAPLAQAEAVLRAQFTAARTLERTTG